MATAFSSWFNRNQNKQVAVIGLGRFGTSVARTFYQVGYEVLAVDADEDRVNCASSNNIATQIVQLDATDPIALKQAGIEAFGLVVIAIGNYFAESVLATLNVKGLGCHRIIAKAVSTIHGEVLSKVGADQVVYPEAEMGRTLALRLTATGLLESLELDTEHSIVEMVAPHSLADKPLQELNLRARYGVSVLAIQHDSQFNVNPLPSDTIQDGDVVVLIGANRDLDKLAQMAAPNEAIA
ncbi:TrkA family potassium uptake protein [Synechococcus sp. PCC 7336]|uniref:potassium channel family protein n=1 Tax=Synechococcus sp. PCC 7336 TaxID=195250 RepID=UPI00034DFCC0|nr:TrkA family potassium uptake protein [Synechococcus sp. PCC 7336]